MAEVLVKICGLTREQDVDAAVAAGADMVGFVVVASSPRGITAERARRLAAGVPSAVRTVAVYDDAATVAADALEHFDLVQMYGLAEATARTIVGFREPPPATVPDGVPLLLDRPRDSSPSPQELIHHWRQAARVRAPVILAGSLHPGNVAEAVRAARPWAVDTARGVEKEPGVKDHGLIERFIRNAKDAA